MVTENDLRIGATQQQQQDPKLKALSDRIDAMVEAAKPVKDVLNAQIDANYRYAFNDQLRGKDRDAGWPRVQMNMHWPAMRQEIAVIAQRRPSILAVAAKKDEEEKARWWSGNLQYRFDTTLRMRDKCIKAGLDGALSGWYIAKIDPDFESRWDDAAGKWIYAPRVNLLHSRNFGLDPNAESFEDAQYVYCRRAIPVDQAVELWPEFEDEIRNLATIPTEDELTFGTAPAAQMKAETQKGVSVSKQSAEGAFVDFVNMPFTQARAMIPQLNPETKSGSLVVIVTEIYFKDRRTKNVTKQRELFNEELIDAGAVDAEYDETGMPTGNLFVKNPDAPEFAKLYRKLEAGETLTKDVWPQVPYAEVEEPVFPHGRYVVKLGTLILNPEDEKQVYTRTRWPFEVGVRIPLPHVPYGLSAVEMAKHMQDWVNLCASLIGNHLRYFGGSRITAETGTFPDDKLAMMAGLVRWVTPGKLNAFKEDAGNAMNPSILQALQWFTRQLQDELGMHDQAIGAQGRSGDPTATEIATLQQATQVSLGLQILLMDDWIVRVMKQVAELDAMHLEAGDLVRMAGQEYTGDKIAEWTDEYADIEFDIELEVGTNLPYDTERRKQEADRLKAMYPRNPEIDRIVMSAYNIRQAEKVLAAEQLVQQLDQFMAAQEAAAKAAGVPGGQAGAPVEAAPIGA